MENIDISILKYLPELNTKAQIEIMPLAPLSMVEELPGSFYKALQSPSKKMLCGLFENLLGWHIDIADRLKISKEIAKTRKKQKIEYKRIQQGSSYVPLLMEYFSIDLALVPPIMHYDDLWSRSYRRADTVKHIGGTRHMDSDVLLKWHNYQKAMKKNGKWKDEEKKKNDLTEKLFKRYIGEFPVFYSSPTVREYVEYSDKIELHVSIYGMLLENLIKKTESKNICYLGNSEGWVNIKIKSHE